MDCLKLFISVMKLQGAGRYLRVPYCSLFGDGKYLEVAKPNHMAPRKRNHRLRYLNPETHIFCRDVDHRCLIWETHAHCWLCDKPIYLEEQIYMSYHGGAVRHAYHLSCWELLQH